MRNILKTFNYVRSIYGLLLFICVVIAVGVLKIASTVILPFVMAFLLAFLTFPLVKALDRFKIPRLASILIVTLVVIIGIFIFGMVLFASGRVIVDHFIQDETQFYEGRVKLLYDWVADLFDLPNDEALSIWQNLWDQEVIRTFVRDFAIVLSSISFQFISSAVIVVLFLIFILLEASYFNEKLLLAYADRKEQIDRMGNEIISQVTRYLGAKFLFSLANGIIFAVGFHLVGLQFAFVWGFIQFLLNFIPTLGSIAAGVLISFFALLQFWPDPGPVIAVVAIILVVNLILSNFLDPKIIGDHVGISPLVVLISLSLWGYIWGFTGMLIAVPMTVIIRIICENIPMLEPISIMIGSRKSVQKKRLETEKNKKQP